MTTSRISGFGQALRGARHSLHLTQRELGAAIGVAARTVGRWEFDHCALSPAQQRLLLQVIAARDLEQARRLAIVLGSELEAFGVATPAPPLKTTRKAAVDQALYATAEEVDLSPKRLRGAVAELLRRLHALGLSCNEASALLLEGPAPSGNETP